MSPLTELNIDTVFGSDETHRASEREGEGGGVEREAGEERKRGRKIRYINKRMINRSIERYG